MIKRTFHINGMHCTSCAMLIDGDLEELAGVKTAQTNYAKQICEVEFDEARVSDDKIVETIKQTGYDVAS